MTKTTMSGKKITEPKFRFEATRTGNGWGVWDYRQKKLVRDGYDEPTARRVAYHNNNRVFDRQLVSMARRVGLI